MNRKKHLYASLAFGLALAGCAAPGTSITSLQPPKVEDNGQIHPYTCLIVTRINVLELSSKDAGFARLFIRRSGPAGAFYNVGVFDISPGSTFKLAAFRPGKYVWAELLFSGYAGVFKEDFTFDCQDQRVTYIGDVDLNIDWTGRKYSIRFVDRSDRASVDFATEYPVLSSSHPLRFRITDDPRTRMSGAR